MIAPIKNKPNALKLALNIVAFIPPIKKNGITGKSAPIAKKKNEANAASTLHYLYQALHVRGPHGLDFCLA